MGRTREVGAADDGRRAGADAMIPGLVERRGRRSVGVGARARVVAMTVGTRIDGGGGVSLERGRIGVLLAAQAAWGILLQLRAGAPEPKGRRFVVHGDQTHGSVSAAHRCRGNGPNGLIDRDAELGEWLSLVGGICELATATGG